MTKTTAMLIAIFTMLSGCSTKPPACGDAKTIEAVQVLLKQAIEKACECTMPMDTFDQTRSAVTIQMQTPTMSAYDKGIEKISCEATANLGTTMPPEVLWAYPSVRENLYRRFPGDKAGKTTTVVPSQLRASSIRYSSQLADDKKTHIVKLEGHERLATLVAALIEGHAFAPRLITLEEQPSLNPGEARKFVDYAAQKMGHEAYTSPSFFFEDPVINAKFKTLLGKQLETFEYNLSVSNSVVLDGDYIVGEGNAPHVAGAEKAAFAISTWTGAVTAVLHTEDKFHVFGVKSAADLPWPLYNWHRQYNTKGGAPLPELALDGAMCSTLRKIAKDANLRDQADLLQTSDVVACSSNTNCTRFNKDQYPQPFAVLVENANEEVRNLMPDADAYFVDINNDHVNDIWVQSIGGNLSCVNAIPLMGKRASSRDDSYEFDKRFNDLNLDSCGISPNWLRYRNHTFLAIMTTLGREASARISVGTPSEPKTCVD